MVAERIQLKRSKGWRIPEGAVIVDRRTRYGNRYKVERLEAAHWNDDHTSWTPVDGPWGVIRVDGRGYATGDAWGGFGEDRDAATRFAVDLHRRSILASIEGRNGDYVRSAFLGPLVGRTLACWCPLGSPCHGDTLLELAARHGIAEDAA